LAIFNRILLKATGFEPEQMVKNAANRDICSADSYAPLFISVSVGVTALRHGMQEVGK
jgi:hypothetical protein